MDKILEDKIKTYYTKYYRDSCKLPDWQERTAQRLKEDQLESTRMKEMEALLDVSFQNQRHCIIGAGTGGLAIVLEKEFGVDVYGIEPCEEEMTIIHLQCDQANIPREKFKQEPCETLSFEDNMFDIVHCFTVIEHVDDINQCLEQIIRVTKPGGKIYINTPNYAFLYERHYKIPFPTFFPKRMRTLYMKFIGKWTPFFETINFVTEKDIDQLLIKKSDIVWYRLYRPHTSAIGRFAKLWDYLRFKKNITMNQEIIIKKLTKQSKNS
ncbi:MAG: Methyltransferase type 11 [Candidatus Magasanikbacteria bacterium GW2011_GWD2_43_18]|uniref:Methyltransferase type 11 n=1 Tax=Candidatus Magasanikbacteria bacterium GW2011_GWE2_42_7 TaxID=1619052 RepID=A0A0G1BGU7_9BACT|nr:MAG: Methyltransferase type 11 [Candidatus Magasanikbacteria bacterium GW2011_GWC2_42_27]KKS72552.1 MAG: Methyltransferase type 11 [Candidatus Magasanikbacteria bacterium GW2011_GWE2_42_7]KKT05258.1 MAG: Methyltransferase type 11 [Candidatus Magasanikbacteria bacterium GW2011_GWD2_43_18]KKT26120.1 MAG: Methyltransferase type 11 [Candidatus Magasanikbacteria bacterium GW2011_GWA2_43_9]HBB37595.1 hypothetical protein [Candidatus Magasanikbacteria bacterium]